MTRKREHGTGYVTHRARGRFTLVSPHNMQLLSAVRRAKLALEQATELDLLRRYRCPCGNDGRRSGSTPGLCRTCAAKR